MYHLEKELIKSKRVEFISVKHTIALVSALTGFVAAVLVGLL